MLTIAMLTDSPADARSRNGALARSGGKDAETTATAKRILSRQWGAATPAQALFLLGEFAQESNTTPTADRAALPLPPFDPAERAAVHRHWLADGTTKEHNALIRLLDRDFGDVTPTTWFGRVAWLVGATQPEIQGEIRKAKLPPADKGGRVQLPGHLGCRGFLRAAELFPREYKHLAAKAIQEPMPIMDLFGG